jgi:hypothetical protein
MSGGAGGHVRRSLQFQRDLLLELVRQVDVRSAPRRSRLDNDGGDFGIDFLDPHPYTPLIDLSFYGPDRIGLTVQNLFVHEHAVVFDHFFGCVEDLRDGSFIAAFHPVPDKRDARARPIIHSTHTARTCHDGSQGNRKNHCFH